MTALAACSCGADIGCHAFHPVLETWDPVYHASFIGVSSQPSGLEHFQRAYDVPAIDELEQGLSHSRCVGYFVKKTART